MVGAAVSSAAFILDQLSKWLIQNAIAYRDAIEVLPFFNLVHVRNYGVTFSFLSNQHPLGWLYLSLLAVFVCLFLGGLWCRAQSKVERFVYPLIIGGAVGNIVDRIRFGGVVDFLDFYAFNYHWPAFNLADSFIVIGVGVLLVANVGNKD